MNEPLANKLRPTKLSDVIGQSHLIGKDKIITNLVKNKRLVDLSISRFVNKINDSTRNNDRKIHIRPFATRVTAVA